MTNHCNKEKPPSMGRESNPPESAWADVQLCTGLRLQSASLEWIPTGIFSSGLPQTLQHRRAYGRAGGDLRMDK